jgi:hypothetical protein
MTMFFYPALALLGRPVPAQARHFSQMLDGMIEIDQFMNLLGSQAQRLDQARDVIPNPYGPIAHKQQLIFAAQG